MDRALALLVQVAGDDGRGARLRDLAASARLDPSTAHRLLASLARYGFVDHDRLTRRYSLGLEFYTIAAAASNRHALAASLRRALTRLVAETGFTALAFLRSSGDLVCVDLQPGALETSASPLDLGSRWPIAAGAPGIAVLAALPEEEAEDLAVQTLQRFSLDAEMAVRAVRQRLLRARALGYASEADAAGGLMTLAVAILDAAGRPEGALALNGPEPLLSATMLRETIAALAREAQAMDAVLAHLDNAIAHREIKSDA